MIRIQIYNKLSADYWLTSLIISAIVFSIYLFFTTKVETFPLYILNLWYLATLSILIGYEYALINYFFSNVYRIFGKLNPLFKNGQYKIFSHNLEKKLRKSLLYYLTMAVVLTPFVISELSKILNGKYPYFYYFEPGPWSLLLDVFNHIIVYSTLFLLAVIIWIIIELVLIVSEMRGKYSISINVFDIDETAGGLKSLRSFILSIVSNYFIIITLAIISSAPENYIIRILVLLDQILPGEIPGGIPSVTSGGNITDLLVIIIFSLMLPIGIILFIITQKTIRNLTDKGVNAELQKIKRKYKETYDKTIEISSNKKNTDNEKELRELKTILDILEIEERKIKEINPKKSDVKAIATFTTTVLLPIIALIEKITGLIGFKP